MAVEFTTVSHANSSITEVETGKWNSIVTSGGRVTVDGVVCYYGNVLKTKKKVDLTEIDSISATFSLNSYTNRVNVGIIVSTEDIVGTSHSYSYYVKTTDISTNTDTFPVTSTLDTTDLIGEYYVGFTMYSYDTSSSKHNGYIYDISELEVKKVPRKLQDGIVGSTNVIEGMVINDSLGQIVNYAMLYNAGDECTDVTGGWGNTGYSYTNLTVVSATKNADNIYLSAGSTSKIAVAGTLNAINLTEYSMLFATSSQSANYTHDIRVLGGKSISSSATRYANISPNDGITAKKMRSADISSINAEAYIVVTCSGTVTATFYNAVLTKSDDITTLCTKAGLSAPIDLATLIADTASITAILNNADAVKFMIKKCTGDFMASFVASADCLTLLESSPYKTIVQANEHWAKFLAMVA